MSFIEYSPNSDFPIENLPFGIFSSINNTKPRPGVAIGDYVLDLAKVKNYFDGPIMRDVADQVFDKQTLNAFMSLSRDHWKETRVYLTKLLSKDTAYLRDNKYLRAASLVAQKDVKMHLPADIGDYTDFYASIDHATNVGAMFRGPGNELMPNYKHLPVGYHGRASSVVVSGTPIARPSGQTAIPGNPPKFGACQRLDFELEVGCFIGGHTNKLGEPIGMSKIEDNLFGLVLLNDWSARDIQIWEYQPLGPFLAKNFGTSISPWIVTFEALKDFIVPNHLQDPQPLPYLQHKDNFNFNIDLEVLYRPAQLNATQIISRSNFSHLYWTVKQMLAHHSITGCNMRPGDLLGTGTISGPAPGSYGSMLEICWKGTKPIKFNDQISRSYIEDGDEVILRGSCKGANYKIGFGDCSGVILPTLSK